VVVALWSGLFVGGGNICFFSKTNNNNGKKNEKSLSICLSLPPSLPLPFSLSLSITHTRTHSYTPTHSQTHIHKHFCERYSCKIETLYFFDGELFLQQFFFKRKENQVLRNGRLCSLVSSSSSASDMKDFNNFSKFILTWRRTSISSSIIFEQEKEIFYFQLPIRSNSKLPKIDTTCVGMIELFSRKQVWLSEIISISRLKVENKRPLKSNLFVQQRKCWQSSAK